MQRKFVVAGFSIALIAAVLIVAIGLSIYSDTPIRKASSIQKWSMSHSVPDSTSAVIAAVSAWLPVYGFEVYNEMPFKAILIGDTLWVVEGTLPKGMLGGVAEARILKRDGRIRGIRQGK